MAKRFVQDVVPAGRRSIRNIPLPESRGGASEERVTDSVRPRKVQTESPVRETKSEKPKNSPKSAKGSRKWWLWLAGAAVVLAGIYFGSYFFVSADVQITPKTVTTPVSVAGSADLDTSANGLVYTIVTLEREGAKEVPATGDEKVEKKASGKIVIYNNAGTAPQQLVANTRFESTGGLIYRIQNAVTVPGAKTANGVTTPGSVSAVIYADQAGDKYNIGLSDFTIPGFKGDAKYTKITAKSDPASPISGGFVGTAKKVSAADMSAAKLAIETKLKSDLQDLVEGQIPDNQVLFRNAETFSFTELPQAPGSSASTAMVREKGTIYGILFDRNALSKYLADKLLTTTDHDTTVENLSSLSFTLDNMSTFNPVSTKTITFKLSGTANFVWNLDPKAISESLAGQKRANIKDILGKYEAVSKANVSIVPIWIFSMPDDQNKIKVEIEPAE